MCARLVATYDTCTGCDRCQNQYPDTRLCTNGQSSDRMLKMSEWRQLGLVAAHLNAASLMHAIDRHCMKRRNDWSYRISKTAFRKVNRTGKKSSTQSLFPLMAARIKTRVACCCHAMLQIIQPLYGPCMARIIMHVSSLESLLILKQMYSHKSAQHNYSGALGCLPMIWDWWIR